MRSGVMHGYAGPPPGVDEAEWWAHVDAEARARFAVEQQLGALRAESQWAQAREARRYRRRMNLLAWALVIGAALVWTIAERVGWTPVLLTVGLVAWWRAGHPGLQWARDTSAQLVRRQ